MDGSGSATGGNGREIDIMESKWKPEGPQANLPTADGTQWGDFSSKQMGKWSDVGSSPLKDYVIFGVLIRDDNLWFYGYKPDGSQWYASDPIPKSRHMTRSRHLCPTLGRGVRAVMVASPLATKTLYIWRQTIQRSLVKI